MRLPLLNDGDIEKDLTEGKIIRTHLLRPTWHFVSAKDIRWLLQLTAPRVHAVNAYMYRKLDLDDKTFSRCNDIIVNVLQGGKQRTRNEINEALATHKIIATGHRLSYIMMQAELNGIICSGARRGNQFTYALLEERVKATESINIDEALAKLTLRYFASRGPATPTDFSIWSGLTLTDCKKGVDLVKNKLERQTVDGAEYYMSPGIPDKKATSGIYLLPIYDELLMGYKDREALFHSKNTLKHDAPLKYDCMIVCDGQVIGTWKRTIKTKHIDLYCDFFTPLTSSQRALFEKSIDRFEAFHGLKVNIVRGFPAIKQSSRLTEE